MNQTDIENTEYIYDVRLMLLVMLSVSFCPSFCHFINHMYSDIKNKYNSFKLPVRKIVSIDDLLIDECSICLDKYIKNDKVSDFQCGHIFHKDCIKIWLSKNNTCPQCREIII